MVRPGVALWIAVVAVVLQCIGTVVVCFMYREEHKSILEPICGMLCTSYGACAIFYLGGSRRFFLDNTRLDYHDVRRRANVLILSWMIIFIVLTFMRAEAVLVWAGFPFGSALLTLLVPSSLSYQYEKHSASTTALPEEKRLKTAQCPQPSLPTLESIGRTAKYERRFLDRRLRAIHTDEFYHLQRWLGILEAAELSEESWETVATMLKAEIAERSMVYPLTDAERKNITTLARNGVNLETPKSRKPSAVT